MSDRISKSKIPEALDALRALGAKELDDVSARDAIRKMRRQIERVLRLGYTYEEVSTTLAGLDININGERIKYLLNDIRKKTRKKTKSSNGDGMEKNIDKNCDINSDTNSAEVDTLQSSEISESSEINKSLEVREISVASTSPTATENNQKSSPVESNRKTLSTKSNKNQNNTRDNNTNSFAFQPQLIDDEDL
ncbi:hypothetical protein [Calothrix sp. PCC 6303]|jgi:hypothetical protein|uniref:hypothetical protein n=1 Tax=Calothrix sp. PCC 6303 TaxID=1170562 RepID=UPI0002A050D4|nr:hypothetical protein [Calothrix sp. PCC 6303]AFZ04600.1 hypothetical protein Cal6303_5733 [Calothrix sp. PCC 6303]